MIRNIKIRQHPNGFYYAYARGEKHPFSLRTKNKEEAERLVRDRRLNEVVLAKQANALTEEFIRRAVKKDVQAMSVCVTNYIDHLRSLAYSPMTIYHTEAHLKRWLRDMELTDMSVEKVTREHVDAWVNAPSGQKYNTRLRNLRDISGLFRWAQTIGLVTANPAGLCAVRTEQLSQAQRIPLERLPFTDEEVARILCEVHPGDFWHAATLLSYETGLRLTDCAKLEKTSLIGRTLTVATVKSGIGGNTIVQHRLSEGLVSSLKIAAQKGGHERWFFPEVAGQLDHPKEQSKYSQQFRRLCLKVGIEGKSFHGLRHTYAMRQRERERRRIFQEMLDELSVLGVQKQLGHASPETTKIYLRHTVKP